MNDPAVIDTGIPALADDTLLQVAERAEQRIKAVNKIKILALQVTNARDWTDQGGRPYLQASGGEKVARLFGISWTISEPIFEAEEGGHFSYTYTGRFSLSGAMIEAVGTRSSKDGFFKKYGPKDDNGEKETLPPSEIDKGDVKKSAYTNLIGNGITRLLGIRNLTWEDLAAAGIKKDSVGKVDYRTGTGGAKQGAISEAQSKRLYAIAKGSGKSDDQVKAKLKEYGYESSLDILKEKYDEICAWAQTKAQREPGEDG
jgi:hypothetical protein